jgi:uncharacterized tellurite resistance protein B-like protein
MLDKLSRTDRLRLMRFICSFAWADLDVHSKERSFVTRMVKRLKLDEEEAAQVNAWLDLPPRPEEVDPADIPTRHRKLFLDAIKKTIEADGVVVPEEREAYELLEELIGS